MTFRFKFHYYNKNYKCQESGFILTVDDEFENIEYCRINKLNKILTNQYYPLSNVSKDKIKQIIIDNHLLMNINSFLYNEYDNSDQEYSFYFEIGEKNRKIEGSNLINKNNSDVKILLKVFDQICAILKEENYCLSLNKFYKK